MISAQAINNTNCYQITAQRDKLAQQIEKLKQVLNSVHYTTGGRRWEVEQKKAGWSSVNWMTKEDNVIFHFNPRPSEGKIVMNTRVNGNWMAVEERIPYDTSKPVKASIVGSKAGFEVYINNDLVHFYKARMNLEELNDIKQW